jgi:hypothetical protein
MSSQHARSSSRIKSRPAVRVGSNLEKNLSAYAAAAGAVIVAAAMPADAQIIYTPSNTPMAIATQNHGPVTTQLDINNDGIADFTFTMSSTAHFSSIGYTTRARFFLKVTGAQSANGAVKGHNGPTAAAIAKGQTIGPQDQFASGAYLSFNKFLTSTGKGKQFGSWRSVEYAFIGLKFLINGQIHYGWARIKFPYAYGISYPSIYGYAYESQPNTPIVAGQTSGTAESAEPAPASLGMLAAGALALSQWHTQRAQ